MQCDTVFYGAYERFFTVRMSHFLKCKCLVNSTTLGCVDLKQIRVNQCLFKSRNNFSK